MFVSGNWMHEAAVLAVCPRQAHQPFFQTQPAWQNHGATCRSCAHGLAEVVQPMGFKFPTVKIFSD